MKYLFLFFIPVLCALSCTSREATQSTADTPATTQGKKIIAYVHGWKDNWTEAEANRVTHINFAFANIKGGKVVLGKPGDAESMTKLNAMKKWNPDLKILISVGGWSWSKNFSDAVLTDSSREVFAQSAVDFMLTHKLDGVDLDWEYPNQIGDGNTYRPEDIVNFTEILKLIRLKLDGLGKNNPHYLLTIASAANQKYLDNTQMDIAHQYLDFINIMTYDYRTGGSQAAGHHANLYFSDADNGSYKSSSDKAVTEHVNAGIPIGKLVLGVPFYGRGWTVADTTSHGRYQLASKSAGGHSYEKLVDSFINKKGYTRYWDESAQAPYLWNPETQTFISYEDPEAFSIKTDYINKKGMGGVMFWQYNGDTEDHVLLRTLAEGLFTAKAERR